MEKHKCEYCNKEMLRHTMDFIKCSDRQCEGSKFGVRHNEPREVRGVAHLLKKKV